MALVPLMAPVPLTALAPLMARARSLALVAFTAPMPFRPSYSHSLRACQPSCFSMDLCAAPRHKGLHSHAEFLSGSGLHVRGHVSAALLL